MSSDKYVSGALADPTTLEPYHRKPKDSTSGTAKPNEELLQVVIETPRGSRNKYSFDPEQRVFRLKSALPAGMVFPFDFGFVPGTIGGDGDPLDVLVLMEDPAFPGCVLLVRLLGAIEVEQTEKGKTKRNDRLIAVAEVSQLFANLKTVDDLPRQLRTEIDEFFTTYHRLQGKQSRTLSWKKPAGAQRLIDEARKKHSAE
ncbi:MAG TPA: inorganic diphosphatase [Acidobacteriaceae bacterium]|nr:inorganic diphosphatase [Acidobacteriaceae bacterium]